MKDLLLNLFELKYLAFLVSLYVENRFIAKLLFRDTYYGISSTYKFFEITLEFKLNQTHKNYLYIDMLPKPIQSESNCSCLVVSTVNFSIFLLSSNLTNYFKQISSRKISGCEI